MAGSEGRERRAGRRKRRGIPRVDAAAVTFVNALCASAPSGVKISTGGKKRRKKKQRTKIMKRGGHCGERENDAMAAAVAAVAGVAGAAMRETEEEKEMSKKTGGGGRGVGEGEERREKERLTGWPQQTRSKPNLPVLPLATTTTYRTITCNQSISGLSSFFLSLSSFPSFLSLSLPPSCPMHRVCAGIVESPSTVPGVFG